MVYGAFSHPWGTPIFEVVSLPQNGSEGLKSMDWLPQKETSLILIYLLSFQHSEKRPT